MALNDLEDRLESAIRHINTSLDIDPWAQNLAVESMRMRIALMKGGQPEIIRCKDCYHLLKDGTMYWCTRLHSTYSRVELTDFCSKAERSTND